MSWCWPECLSRRFQKNSSIYLFSSCGCAVPTFFVSRYVSLSIDPMGANALWETFVGHYQSLHPKAPALFIICFYFYFEGSRGKEMGERRGRWMQNRKYCRTTSCAGYSVTLCDLAAQAPSLP